MERIQLKNVTTIVNGSTPSTANSENWDGDIAWITPKDLSNFQQRFISNGSRNITETGYNSCSTTMVPKGTVLLTSRAPIGYLAIASNPLCTNQGFKSLICDANRLLPLYLYYWLSTKVEYLKSISDGATFKELSKTTLENVEIDLPDIETQQHIVGTIGTIDDLIEKEQELLMKIESFEKKLFSAAFEQERKNHYRLSEVCDFVPGYSYTSDELVDSPMGMVTIKSVDRAGGFKAEGIKSLLPESSLKSEKMCQVGDVLVAHTDLTKNQEIIGSPIIVATTGGFHSLTFSMDMVKVEPKNHLFSRPLIYQILKSQSFKAHALGYCNGSTVIHLSKGALANYEFDGPMASDIVDINGKLSDTYKVKISIVNKLEKLAESKRILLERYF